MFQLSGGMHRPHISHIGSTTHSEITTTETLTWNVEHAESTVRLNPLYTGTLADREDPDAIQHTSAFHQGLHFCLYLNNLQKQKYIIN